jgi:hypothetical protein
MESTKKRAVVTMIIIVTMVLTETVVPLATFGKAQEKPEDNMEVLREKLRADKKVPVSDTMGLTESEAKAFWPLYESYQKKLTRLNDRTIKVIENYAANYRAMSDEVARRLIDESMAVEQERYKVHAAYLPQFRKILPEKKVALYYQLENKAQALLNYEMAINIPLVQ